LSGGEPGRGFLLSAGDGLAQQSAGADRDIPPAWHTSERMCSMSKSETETGLSQTVASLSLGNLNAVLKAAQVLLVENGKREAKERAVWFDRVTTDFEQVTRLWMGEGPSGDPEIGDVVIDKGEGDACVVCGRIGKSILLWHGDDDFEFVDQIEMRVRPATDAERREAIIAMRRAECVDMTGKPITVGDVVADFDGQCVLRVDAAFGNAILGTHLTNRGGVRGLLVPAGAQSVEKIDLSSRDMPAPAMRLLEATSR
jgi:hypothetical protein